MTRTTHPGNLTFFVLSAVALALLAAVLIVAPPAGADVVSWCETSGQSAIPLNECKALEELYISTNGATWTDNNGWLSSLNVCGEWTGISCNGGHVTGILLITNNLTGVLPSTLDQLTFLENLELTANAIGGTIPATVGSISSLTDLSLGSNQLTGSIPVELGQLSLLETLDLGNNKLSGAIPDSLGDLPNLTLFLYLDGNQLTGKVPDKVCALSPNFANIDYNMLDVYTTVSACDTTFVNWRDTQTVPPSGVAAAELNAAALDAATAANVTVSWLPIAYKGDGGGYQVFARNISTSAVTFLGETNSKGISFLDVEAPGLPKDFAYFVRTRTDAHTRNQSELTSENSNEATLNAVAITTLAFGAQNPAMSFAVLAPLVLLLLTAVTVLVVKRR